MSVSFGRPERTAAPTEPPKQRRWGSIFFTVIAVVGSLHALLMIGLEGGRYLYTQREITRLTADIDVLQEETRTLQAVLRHQNDPIFREQLAREQGFIGPDETRIMTRTP